MFVSTIQCQPFSIIEHLINNVRTQSILPEFGNLLCGKWLATEWVCHVLDSPFLIEYEIWRLLWDLVHYGGHMSNLSETTACKPCTKENGSRMSCVSNLSRKMWLVYPLKSPNNHCKLVSWRGLVISASWFTESWRGYQCKFVYWKNPSSLQVDFLEHPTYHHCNLESSEIGI